MRLFEPTGEYTKAVYRYCEDEKVLLCPERQIMRMIPDTIEYLLGNEGGKTITRVRYLIANLYNNNRFPNVELFSMIRNADTEHQELIMDIIGINQSKYGKSCFKMIEELAPKIIEKFNLEENEEKNE